MNIIYKNGYKQKPFTDPYAYAFIYMYICFKVLCLIYAGLKKNQKICSYLTYGYDLYVLVYQNCIAFTWKTNLHHFV